MANSGFAGK